MRRFSLMRSLLGKKGFTLIEMLVAITVLVILLAILFSITNTVAKTVVNTSVKLDTFAAARTAFDLMSQKLSQATLNTYWDYDNPVQPQTYYRQSDLQFIVKANVQNNTGGATSGYGQEVYFTTPATYSASASIRSTDGLLNACGYFVSYGPETSFRPPTLAATPRYRYRLMQGLEPTENLAVYSNWPATPTGTQTWTSYWSGSWATFWANQAWINTINNLSTGLPNTNDTPVANNIIALIVWPHLSVVDDPPNSSGMDGGKLTNKLYAYDSQANALTLVSGVQPLTANQLPPTVQLTMIAISEASASRLNMTATAPTVIESALKGKFVVATYTQYQADLASVTTSLAANHIAFEILNTSVTMKESKWSDNSQ